MIVKFDDVKDQTTEEYFNNNQFSIDAFNKKYSLYRGETYVQALKRVCDSIASVEKTAEDRQYWSDRWFDEIYNDWWHPAGSIMQGAGSNRNVSLVNCTHVSLGGTSPDQEWDNLEAIFKSTGYKIAKYAAFRQGLGVDFSRLRPRNTSVMNSANKSTGSVHWMQFLDQIGYFVGQSGRIPAFLFSISINHPDVEEFITVKSDYTKIQNANISVQCTDDFYKAVENDDDWEMVFKIPEIKIGDKIYVNYDFADKDCLTDEYGRTYYIAKRNRPAETFTKTIKARKLLELIAKNMYNHAEPGIQNIDIARKYSNSDYVYDPDDIYDSRICGTNACSEQYLSPDSCCVLGSINVGKFSTDPDQYEKELSKIGESICRFLDNVNEYELVNHTYATPEQRIAIEKLRRIGAGYTNIAAWLLKQNIEYGSEESCKVLEKFTERYNYYLYKSSIELGKIKGSFGLFKREKFEKSPFVKRMMKLGLEFSHMRNVTCSSIAPTGTLSLMFRDLVMSYGIEPAFGMYYWKRTRIEGEYTYYFNVPRAVREVFEKANCPIPMNSDSIKDTWDGSKGLPIAKFIEDNKSKLGIKFKNATEISPFSKLELMSRVMKWIDSSISVTYLLPENTDWKDIYNFILLAHKKSVKSIAAFPDRKMYGIVSYIPFKDLAVNLINQGVSIDNQNFSDEELKILNLSRENIGLKTHEAPKRLKSLDADIYIVTVSGQKFIIAIGLQNNSPYEIFGGMSNGLNLKNGYQKGKITKVKQGHYSLEIGDIVIDDFSEQFTPVEQLLFRVVSTMLRHGIPIQYIVEQLQKANKDIGSLPAATTRVLKKYIKDGQKVTGQKCSNCGGDSLVYLEGCCKCTNCDWSKCQ